MKDPPIGDLREQARQRAAGRPPMPAVAEVADLVVPEAAALARALRTAGTTADLLVFGDAGHGFMGGGTAPAAAARDATLTALASFLAASRGGGRPA